MDKVRDHFIDGADVKPGSGAYVQSFNPCKGTPEANIARGNAADVDKAVTAAVAAFPDWRRRRPIERGRVLMKLAEKIREKISELAAIESAETGKPLWQSPLEIEVAAQYFEFYAGLVNLPEGEKVGLGGGYHSYTVHEPYGAVGIITPWNAPLNQGARGIAPALAAGNTVVAKPSEFTSSTTLAVAKMAVEECGMPPGVFNVVLGEGPEAGAALVAHKSIRKVAFTGSVRAGREIGKIAAERIIPLTLELGGKSPNIVFEDATLADAVPGSIRAFVLNAGQVCLAGTRLLVQKSIHDAFVDQLVAGLGQIKVGPQQDAMVGPLTTRDQLERVHGFFDLAASEGAIAATGGHKNRDPEWGDGWFVPPTVYTNVTNDMRIAREEVFGPVLVVIPFEDEADAIRIANDTEYGLAAGIWSNDLGRAHRVAAELEAGQIYVNEYQAGGVETPLGGFKNSGYGREKGVEALKNYTHTKSVTIKL
ncbi:aldehyde dehydrogenase family protein [Pyruvatibacter mobilis]|uniref:aldehyde dehydrogenase family protein n=1 Tax=Pyruvatibacter mobilis TaxID=1712261 RepID=UPI003D138588